MLHGNKYNTTILLIKGAFQSLRYFTTLVISCLLKPGLSCPLRNSAMQVQRAARRPETEFESF